MSRARRTRVNGGIVMRICITKRWKQRRRLLLIHAECPHGLRKQKKFMSMGRSSVSVPAIPNTLRQAEYHLSQALAGAVAGILAGVLCAASPEPIDQISN